MRNIRLTVAYDGTGLGGWQRQPDIATVQGILESALAKILGEATTVLGSGRTDAGVHAANQVANFKTACPIPCSNLVKAINDVLAPNIRVKDALNAPPTFNARYGAVCKTYRYRILRRPVASPFIARYVWHYPYPLDLAPMKEAAKALEGEHDFTSFAAAASSVEERGESTSNKSRAKSKVRTIYSSTLISHGRTSILIYEVRGNGFLHHMVRNIVGTLVEVGRGRLQPSDLQRILLAHDRTLAGPTAPAQGLCLWRVDY